MSKRPDDTIEFALSAEETVINNTVKVTASIAGIIQSNTTEQKLKEPILTLLKKFIEADWQFSNMNRTPHQSGYEQFMVTATCRVSESENYGLDRRRIDASRDIDQMQIVSVHADISPTASQIDETQSKLRVAIIKKALAETDILNEAIGQDYRIGKVFFHDLQPVHQRGNMVMAAMASNVGYGSDAASGGSEEFGNAVKLTMQASVELRITR